jgi:hypothetical protein
MKHVMMWSRTAMLALALAAVVPMTARAQSLVETPVTTNAAVVAPAPSFGPVQTQVGVSRAVSATAPMIAQQQATRRDVSWMVLGGATLIVGSIVGGDGGTIIMIVGGVIGLTGLWRYLQYS